MPIVTLTGGEVETFLSRFPDSEPVVVTIEGESGETGYAVADITHAYGVVKLRLGVPVYDLREVRPNPDNATCPHGRHFGGRYCEEGCND